MSGTCCPRKIIDGKQTRGKMSCLAWVFISVSFHTYITYFRWKNSFPYFWAISIQGTFPSSFGFSFPSYVLASLLHQLHSPFLFEFRSAMMFMSLLGNIGCIKMCIAHALVCTSPSQVHCVEFPNANAYIRLVFLVGTLLVELKQFS